MRVRRDNYSGETDVIKYERVPYRSWRGSKARPILTMPGKRAAYHRVMRQVLNATQSGKAVEFEHRIINAAPKYGKPYDVISATIGE